MPLDPFAVAATIAPRPMADADGLAPPERVPSGRVKARGKFLVVDGEMFPVRGVTYGPFAPDPQGQHYHTPDVAARDFAHMAASGFNAVRTYTVPPPWLLDAATEHGLRVLVGLPWEQHIDFLASRRRARDIRKRVGDGVGACAGHPAVLGFAVGNEIPAPVVRWYGHRPIERHLRDLYLTAKGRDPDALVTYVNYPSTEYLELPFLDVVSFNVFLESRRPLRAYVARLQNIAGDRPLLMAEVGLDSTRNGESKQARVLRWQLRTLQRAGCAGSFVFAWTDEWHRGGADIDDWSFGLTTRLRQPKPAMTAVRQALTRVRGPAADRGHHLPGISVVVCTYNGSRTIADCLRTLQAIEYFRHEVIVVDDGSTDSTAEIVGQFDVRVIRTENRGLSSARNTGLAAARYEIVAYVDDDAAPHPLWLDFLADSFAHSRHAGVGGPNVPLPDAGWVETAVGMAPGGPIHVLLTDEIAEHIPGCNMAFRRSCLNEIGGFDTQFRIAGDDVDICWRLQERGWTLGFNPAAMVWHHRRHTLLGYWRQQVNYGKAEADLERKWPRKYNAAGHLSWAGRLYANGLLAVLGWWGRGRIYQGMWGSAPFQSETPTRRIWLWSLPLMPEWYLLAFVLAAGSALGLLWRPLLGTLPVLALLIAVSLTYAAIGATRAAESQAAAPLRRRIGLGLLAMLLHVVQPAARLWGRVRRGLTPWRRRGGRRARPPWPRTLVSWSEQWHPPDDRLRHVERALADCGAVENRGGSFDRWDIEVRGGMLGCTRLRLLVEEHGQGRQLARYRIWPRLSSRAATPVALLGFTAAVAALDGSWEAAMLFGGVALLVCSRATYECAAATATMTEAVMNADPGTKAFAPAPRPGDSSSSSASQTDVLARDDEAGDLELGTP